jgi:cytochrome c oxidase subunit IV
MKIQTRIECIYWCSSPTWDLLLSTTMMMKDSFKTKGWLTPCKTRMLLKLFLEEFVKVSDIYMKHWWLHIGTWSRKISCTRLKLAEQIIHYPTGLKFQISPQCVSCLDRLVVWLERKHFYLQKVSQGNNIALWLKIFGLLALLCTVLYTEDFHSEIGNSTT